MDNNDTEREIKIEYNETNDIDPLSEFASGFSENQMEPNIYYGERNNVSQFYGLTDLGQTNQVMQKCKKLNLKMGPVASEIRAFKQTFLCSPYKLTLQNIPTEDVNWYRSVDTSGRLLCRFCDLKYSTVGSLRHHATTKHPDDAKKFKISILNSKRNAKLKCHICKIQFSNILDIQRHMNLNHSLKTLKSSCLYCDSSFDDKNALSEHIFYKHSKLTNAQVHTCNICGYRTWKKSHFDQHAKTHLVHKTMQCKYCEYATNHSPNLKIHERIHTDCKPYVCNYEGCDYRCAAKSALRSHQLKHFPEENMLYCDKCSYSTVYRQSLKRHIDSHKRNSIRL